MNWSKLRKEVQALSCPELQGRIDFHKAIYRKSYDSIYDRAWITINGEEVYSLSHGEWTQAYLRARKDAIAIAPDADSAVQDQITYSTMKDAQVEGTKYISCSLYRYLELSAQEALESENIIIRAFAIVDRRVGKRTLAKIRPAPDEHELVRRFYNLRMAASQDQRSVSISS